MRPIALALAGLALSGCELPDFFAARPDLVVDPPIVDVGITDLEVTDEQFVIDFRSVADVDDFGDFVVREWSSNDERVFVQIDVFDDAFGSQDLILRLDDEDVLQATFTVR